MSKAKFYSLLKLFLLILLSGGLYQANAQYNIVVAKDGSGDYTTIKAALNAVPDNSTTTTVIFIKAGVYTEKDTVGTTKNKVTIVGESVANTILTYNDNANTPAPGGGTLGTSGSGTLYVFGTDFTAINMTFQNNAGVNAGQAVAIYIKGDRAAFRDCRFLGFQDTVYTNSSAKQYFKNCYIDGTVDFIFGASTSLFDSCILYCKARSSGGNIVAPNTLNTSTYGYVLNNCTVNGGLGMAGLYTLGRPWQNNPKAVYFNCNLTNVIAAAGWSAASAGSAGIADSYFAEYNSTGAGANAASRLAGTYQLSSTDAANYTKANILSGWDPCTAISNFCTPIDTPLAVSNFTGVKGTTTTQFTWNLSWPLQNVNFQLYRSTDSITFTQVATLSSLPDSSVNFQLTDPIPPQGTIYYYYLVATKTGYTTQTTQAVKISSAPTLTVTGAVSAFSQSLGTPSPAQSYTLSGVNLSANVFIYPPANFEVSGDGGTTWYNSASATPLTFTPTAGNLSASVNVRLNATALGNYSGNILDSTTGGISVPVAVSGATTNAPAITSLVLQQWPLDISNADSAAVRAAGITASTPSFTGLYSANGTTVTAIPAYSTTYGQAFGPSTNGDGTWSLVGGTLKRTYYEQFTVTAAAGYSVRLDSLILNAAFYNTSSNTKLAVVYSTSGFTTDSTDIYGGSGPSGGLPSTANGSFANPIALLNQTSGPVANYRLAFTGTNAGVTLAAGKTLTIRLYFACGSSSAGRYATIENVIVKGLATSTAAGLPFTAGNIVAVRVGDATNTISVNASPVYLEEYNITTNPITLVQSIPVPSVTNGVNKRLTLTSSPYEGYLSRSYDGRYLALAGYDAGIGYTAALTDNASTTNRVVAIVDNLSNINTTTSLTDFANANNPISAVTSNGTDIWVCANYSNGTGGTRYTTKGATTTTQVNNTIGGNGPRVVNIFGGQLYVSNNTNSSVVAIGSGLPVTGSQTVNNLAGLPVATGRAYQFFFADLNASVAGLDVLYIADDGSNGTTNQGIQKYSLVGGSWLFNGSIAVQGGSLRGITGVVSGNTVTVVASSPNGIFTYADNTGYSTSAGSFSSATITTYKAPATGGQFRGVALAPQAVSVLPLNLLSFNAVYNNGVVNTSWTTANEVNTSNFIVERSADGSHFTGIGTVTAKDNFSINNYTFDDIAPLEGVSYYRLKMTDKDGSYTYSQVVKINRVLAASFNCYPNPVTAGMLTVNLPASGSNAVIQVVSLQGAVIASYNIAPNAMQSAINVSALSSGQYILVYRNTATTLTTRFIKQ